MQEKTHTQLETDANHQYFFNNTNNVVTNNTVL